MFIFGIHLVFNCKYKIGIYPMKIPWQVCTIHLTEALKIVCERERERERERFFASTFIEVMPYAIWLSACPD